MERFSCHPQRVPQRVVAAAARVVPRNHLRVEQQAAEVLPQLQLLALSNSSDSHQPRLQLRPEVTSSASILPQPLRLQLPRLHPAVAVMGLTFSTQRLLHRQHQRRLQTIRPAPMSLTSLALPRQAQVLPPQLQLAAAVLICSVLGPVQHLRLHRLWTSEVYTPSSPLNHKCNVHMAPVICGQWRLQLRLLLVFRGLVLAPVVYPWGLTACLVEA